MQTSSGRSFTLLWSWRESNYFGIVGNFHQFNDRFLGRFKFESHLTSRKPPWIKLDPLLLTRCGQWSRGGRKNKKYWLLAVFSALSWGSDDFEHCFFFGFRKHWRKH